MMYFIAGAVGLIVIIGSFVLGMRASISNSETQFIDNKDNAIEKTKDELRRSNSSAK